MLKILSLHNLFGSTLEINKEGIKFEPAFRPGSLDHVNEKLVAFLDFVVTYVIL